MLSHTQHNTYRPAGPHWIAVASRMVIFSCPLPSPSSGCCWCLRRRCCCCCRCSSGTCCKCCSSFVSSLFVARCGLGWGHLSLCRNGARDAECTLFLSVCLSCECVECAAGSDVKHRSALGLTPNTGPQNSNTTPSHQEVGV